MMKKLTSLIKTFKDNIVKLLLVIIAILSLALIIMAIRDNNDNSEYNNNGNVINDKSVIIYLDLKFNNYSK